jgi:hypothetical protein
MQGGQEPHAERAVTITLSTLVPPTHLLRRIDQVLDLNFIYEVTQDLRDWLEDHQEAAAAIQADPLAALWQERTAERRDEERRATSGRMSERDLRSFEDYLNAHDETAQALYQNPELINDRQTQCIHLLHGYASFLLRSAIPTVSLPERRPRCFSLFSSPRLWLGGNRLRQPGSPETESLPPARARSRLSDDRSTGQPPARDQ